MKQIQQIDKVFKCIEKLVKLIKFGINKENNLKNNFIKTCLIINKNHKSQHNKQQIQISKVNFQS